MPSFESFDGQRLAFASHGGDDGGTAPIVCFNGLACDGASWRYLVDHFTPRRRVVTFDYRGHGRSPAPDKAGSATVDASARDGLALMEEVGVGGGVVIGHSMGGQVALEFAHRFPHKVRGIVLVLCAYKAPLSTLAVGRGLAEPILRLCRDQPEFVGRLLRATAPGAMGFLVGRLAGLYRPGYSRRQDWQHYLAHFATMDHATFGSMALDLQAHDAGPYLEHIRVPTLIVAGQRDTISPSWIAHEMHQKIPGSELLMLPHGTHNGHLDEDGLVNRRIEQFIAERVEQ